MPLTRDTCPCFHPLQMNMSKSQLHTMNETGLAGIPFHLKIGLSRMPSPLSVWLDRLFHILWVVQLTAYLKRICLFFSFGAPCSKRRSSIIQTPAFRKHPENAVGASAWLSLLQIGDIVRVLTKREKYHMFDHVCVHVMLCPTRFLCSR